MQLKIDKNNPVISSTLTIEKVLQNIETMGWDYDTEIDIHLLFTPQLLTSVNYVGKYLCVLQIRKDKSQGKMYFLDGRIFKNTDHFIAIVNNVFKGRLFEMLFTKYCEWKSEYSDDAEDVELVLY
jgi:hypothetical protein